MKKILASSGGVYIGNEFEKDGLACQEHVDLSVVFRDSYVKEVLSFNNLKPFLVEIIPNQENQKPFLILLFGGDNWQIIKFCAEHYPCKSIKIIDTLNIWLVPYSMRKIEEYNKKTTRRIK